MEWDQISEKWAAMAQRLRSDRPTHHAPDISAGQDPGPMATGRGGAASGTIGPGHDRDLATYP